MTDEGDFILYDGECPFCRCYIALATLRQSHPKLRVLDARQHPPLVERLRANGFEINDGMIVFLDGTCHYAADATRILADLAPSNRLLRKGILHAIGGAPWSARLYPLLNSGRKLWLRLNGTPLIRSGDQPSL